MGGCEWGGVGARARSRRYCFPLQGDALGDLAKGFMWVKGGRQECNQWSEGQWDTGGGGGGGRSGACAGDLLPTLQCVHQPAEGDRVSGSATESQHVDLVTFDWTAAVSRTYHSIASSRPTPFRAEVLKICHFLSFRAGRPRAFATSVGVIAWSMSCLFAKTTRMAFFSSSS